MFHVKQRLKMKKIVVAVFFLFVIAVTDSFAQTDSVTIFESSDNFAEIKSAFQRRLNSASREFKYFFHTKDTFYFEDDPESELFDKTKMQYFIFEANDGELYYLILVNKKDSKAIGFFFINDVFRNATQCSDVEINKALALYPDL